MKAITLYQPWATLVAIGEKTIETRSWGTKYVGDLAIHSSQRIPKEGKALMEAVFCKEAFARHGVDAAALPLGCIVAICDLYMVVEYITSPIAHIPFPEVMFGDFIEGRYGWLLRRPCKMTAEIRVKGHLGLWEWTR